jgi:hypothetical protein
MSCTELEASIIRAGTALAQAPFGADLVRNHPSRRADPSGAGLADRELSAGPVVQRTVAVLNAAAITRTSPNLTDRDQRYVDWVNRVQRFLQALASELWGDIRGDIRHLFLDDDDLPPGPLSTSYIPALRKPHTRPMRSVAPDILLDPTSLAPLARVWSAAHDTIVYRAAAAAATSVRREQGLREKLAQTRRSYEEQLMPPRGPRYSDDVARWNALLRDAYSSLGPQAKYVVQALRAYNRLVQAAIAATLGWAERGHPLPPLDPGNEPVSVLRDGGDLIVHLLTATEPAMLLHPSSPFEVKLQGPLDGLYLCTGIAVQIQGGAAMVDVWGYRLRELEGKQA